MPKKSFKGIALALCLLIFVGFAPAGGPSVSPTYTAETMVYGEAVCPTLLLGSEDGSLVIRWAIWNDKPVVVHIGPDDGSGKLPAEHTILSAECARASELDPAFCRVEAALSPGDYLYGLSEAGAEAPDVLYPIHWRTGESFRVLMSSDSHIYEGPEIAYYEAAMVDGMREGNADLVIHTGDMADGVGNHPLELSAGSPHTRSVPTLVVCGNHDFPGALYSYYTPPHLEQYTGDYWTVQNRVLFVGINVNVQDMEAHRKYLRKTVEEQRACCDWVVLLIHYSLMSNGEHSLDQPVYDFREALRDVISDVDVDLVISGHDHEYDRSYLIAGKGMTPTSGGETVAKRSGEALYITLPSAVGAKYYKRNREAPYPLAVEALESERGCVAADFTAEGVTFSVWSTETGKEADHFTLTRAEKR